MLAHFQSLFRKGNHDVFWENEDKIHDLRCVNEFFFLTCRLTSCIFVVDELHRSFSEILSKLTHSSRFFSFLYEWLKSTCQIIFYSTTYGDCLVVEILQLVHEISSFPEVLYKRGDLKNFSSVKNVLKKFKMFLNVLAGSLKLYEAATGSFLWKKVFLKRRTCFSEPVIHRSPGK